MKHTKGPWDYVQWDDGDNAIITSEGDGRICEMVTNFPDKERDANAGYIVDCVNACDLAGIEDPGKTIPELVEACNYALGVLESIPKEYLEGIYYALDEEINLDRIKAALEGVKGGKE